MRAQVMHRIRGAVEELPDLIQLDDLYVRARRILRVGIVELVRGRLPLQYRRVELLMLWAPAPQPLSNPSPLQPGSNGQPSLFTVPFAHAKRADFPPGRGFLMRNGKLTGVHVGMP